MYKRGELRIVTRSVCDSRTFPYEVAPKGGYYLPHSCDEWVIGGKHEAFMLIEDLLAAMAGEYSPRDNDDD